MSIENNGEAIIETNEGQSFLDTLPEELRGESSLQDFKDINGLAKSYVSAQQMVGGSLRIPGTDAGQEDKDSFYEKLSEVEGVVRIPDMEDTDASSKFYNRLGRPETAEGYKFEFGEDAPVDKGRLDNFKQVAHSMGLSNAQAAKLAEFDVQERVVQQEQANADIATTTQALKDQWGQDYDARLQGAKQALTTYQDKYPEAVEQLINSEAGNNPAFLSMLSELYTSMKETGAVKTDSPLTQYGKTPEIAEQELAEMNNNQEIWEILRNPMHPDHGRYRAKKEELYRIKSGK